MIQDVAPLASAYIHSAQTCQHAQHHFNRIFILIIMIFQVAPLIVASAIARFVAAEIAPEITTVAEGYNVIAKLPCIGCPFLHQDTSQGSDAPWTERKDDNALVIASYSRKNDFAG